MDDDGSKKLDYEEFKKGIHDYGLVMEDPVSVCWVFQKVLIVGLNFYNIAHTYADTNSR